MNQEYCRLLNKYRLQIFLLFIAIISIIISISIVYIVKDIVEGKLNPKKEEDNILFRLRVSSVLMGIVILYFTFDAIENYRKAPTQQNFVTVVVSLLVLVAAGIRITNIFYRNNDQI